MLANDWMTTLLIPIVHVVHQLLRKIFEVSNSHLSKHKDKKGGKELRYSSLDLSKKTEIYWRIFSIFYLTSGNLRQFPHLLEGKPFTW